jgi:hypothetical protein
MMVPKEAQKLGQSIMDLIAASPLDDDVCLWALLNAVCNLLAGIECLDCRRAMCEEIRDGWPEATANVMKAPGGDHDHQLHSVH